MVKDMSNYEIGTIIPTEMRLPDVSSGAAYIVDKKRVEISPSTSNSTYVRNGSNTIRFQISSISDLADFQNSYVRLDLTTTGTSDGTKNDWGRSLSRGGVHSLFRQVTLQTTNGVVIENIMDYNKVYASLSRLQYSRDYINNIESYGGDSVGNRHFLDNYRMKWAMRAAKYAGIETGDTTNGLDITATETADGALYNVVYNTATPLATTSATGYLLAQQSYKAKGYYTHASMIDASWENAIAQAGYIAPARVSACRPSNTTPAYSTSNSVRLCFKPMLSLFHRHEWFPLFLLANSGLELIFQLDDPERCLCTNSDIQLSASATLYYQIDNPRFIVDMVRPSDEVTNNILALFDSDGYAIPLNLIYCNDWQDEGSMGSFSYSIPCSFRSLNQFIVLPQNQLANTINKSNKHGENTMSYDFTSTIKANLSQYGLSIGSQQFPSGRPLELPDEYNSEAFQELLKCCHQFNSSLEPGSIQPDEYMDFGRDETGIVNTNGQNFMIGIDLDRHGPSPFAGVDVSTVNPIFSYQRAAEHKIITGGAPARVYFKFVLRYDGILVLRRGLGAVLMV